MKAHTLFKLSAFVAGIISAQAQTPAPTPYPAVLVPPPVAKDPAPTPTPATPYNAQLEKNKQQMASLEARITAAEAELAAIKAKKPKLAVATPGGIRRTEGSAGNYKISEDAGRLPMLKKELADLKWRMGASK